MQRRYLYILAMLLGFSAISSFANQFPYVYPRLRPLGNPFITSEGFILGTVIRSTNEGLPMFRYRYEGAVMVGVGTSQGALTDVECATDLQRRYGDFAKESAAATAELQRRIGVECALIINPWRFSFFDSKFDDFLRSLENNMAVLYYEHPPLAPQGTLTDTRNYVRGVWKVDPKLPIEESWEVAWYRLPVSRWLTREKGYVEGRVAAALLVDPIRKTLEIYVQQGERANNFRPFSVSDPNLFDYLVRTMFTGRMIRLEYVKILFLSQPVSALAGFETHYRITKVSVLPQQEETHK